MYSVKYSKLLIDLMNKEVDIYAVNSDNVFTKRIIFAQQFSTISDWIFKCGFALYSFSGGTYLVYPLYSYFCRDEIIPLIPLYMPFIDEKTKSGFIGLTIIHLVIIVLTIIASAAVDFMFITLTFNMIFFGRIFCDNVDGLNDTLRGEEVDKAVAKAKLINILLIHREIFE